MPAKREAHGDPRTDREQGESRRRERDEDMNQQRFDL